MLPTKKDSCVFHVFVSMEFLIQAYLCIYTEHDLAHPYFLIIRTEFIYYISCSRCRAMKYMSTIDRIKSSV